ncbi:SDR family NAD(P)-dependent oxidoreductase [Paramagnetospirillum magneticum]|uniref:Dehydrogenase with different specificities n=1 Tax=Paramagnetospirillum magneticum (strain ATCC 700264 / AMB-1) TaxID=342108 RepID=Q2WB37_PARM1|nr:SDR family oxidoreductase [Paramagnetospirillum magneticum]BAE48938.1 Dehydrogenase with different specificities [Paramagnetospirillum magneticum AMB-1]
MTSLAGKLALVTGGTRGIGAAIAARLLADGAKVMVTGTRPGGEGPAGSGYLAVDFADAAATTAFAEQAAGLGVDILVNNAGINKVSPFAEIDPADFARIQQVNVTAPFLLARAVVPGMQAKAWGRIVTVSSIWGRISRAGRGAYSASKFAVDGLTAALAAEVAQFGILANCVAPGFIDTELTRQVLGEDGIKELTAQVPARRLGRPEEIAAFVAWLAGPENSYISGQNLVIDGGFTRV